MGCPGRRSRRCVEQPAEAERLLVAAGREQRHRQRGVGADRAAVEEHPRLGDVVGPVGEDVADGHRGRAVEDHAERAALVVVEHQHHAAVEVGVDQGRGGDQQVTDAQDDPVRVSHGRSTAAGRSRGRGGCPASSAAARTAAATGLCTSAWKTLGMM